MWRSPASPDTLRHLLSEHAIQPSNNQEYIEGHKCYYSALETRAMARAVWCYLFNYIKTESLNNVIMMRSIVPVDKLRTHHQVVIRADMERGHTVVTIINST